MNKKLYKSKQKTISGVCGGIAEYFDWDVTIVRMVTVLLCVCWGTGLLLYIIFALIMPERPDDDNDDVKYGEYRDI